MARRRSRGGRKPSGFGGGGLEQTAGLGLDAALFVVKNLSTLATGQMPKTQDLEKGLDALASDIRGLSRTFTGASTLSGFANLAMPHTAGAIQSQIGRGFYFGLNELLGTGEQDTKLQAREMAIANVAATQEQLARVGKGFGEQSLIEILDRNSGIYERGIKGQQQVERLGSGQQTQQLFEMADKIGNRIGEVLDPIFKNAIDQLKGSIPFFGNSP